LLLQDYSKSHPWVSFIHEGIVGGSAQYQQVLQTQLAAGIGPDMFGQWGGSLMNAIIDAGYAENLEPYYSKYNWDQLIPEWISQRIRRHGNRYGLPFMATVQAFWYRKDVFDKLGFSIPKTYAEVEAQAQKAKEAGYYYMSLGGVFGWHMGRLHDYLLEVAAGPAVHDALFTDNANWEHPGVIKSFELLKKWTDNWLPPGSVAVNPTDALIPFYMGQALCTINNNAFEITLKVEGTKDPQAKYDFFFQPTDHKPNRLASGPQQFMINSKSTKKEAVAEFLNWYTQVDNQNRFFKEGWIDRTAVKGVVIDATKLPLTAKFKEWADTKLEGTFTLNDQGLVPEMFQTLFEVQAQVITGALTPAQAGKRMQEAFVKWKASRK